MPASSRSGHIIPRPPIVHPFEKPAVSARIMLDPDDTEKLILMIRSVWKEDLATLRHELHFELRPWYIRLMDWWHGR